MVLAVNLRGDPYLRTSVRRGLVAQQQEGYLQGSPRTLRDCLTAR